MTAAPDAGGPEVAAALSAVPGADVGGGAQAAGPAPAAAPPVGGGPVAIDAGAGVDTEGGGDSEAAADEAEAKLEAAAPRDETEEATGPDLAVPQPAEPPAPAPPSAALGGSEPMSGSGAGGAADQATEQAAATAVEPAAAPDVGDDTATAVAGDPAAASESAQLSSAEVDAATGMMAEGAGGGGATGGGGGGGGGSAIPEAPAPATPDVAALSPEDALTTAGSAPPAQLAAALGGVKDSVGTSVATQRSDLAANPPTIERPAGRGAASGPAAPAPTGRPDRDTVEKVPQGRDTVTPAPAPLPALPAPPVDAVAEPAVESTPEGTLTEKDAAQVQGSVEALPETDPALSVTAGPAPQVPVDGNTDPARVDEQQRSLQAGVETAAAEGRADAAVDMGEKHVYDDQPAQTLTAQVGKRGGGGGAATPGGMGPSGPDAETVSIIAGQEKGAEIASAVASAKAEMAAKKQEHGDQVAQEKAKSATEVAALERADAREQAAVRKGVRSEVAAQRGQWTSEQEATVAAANKDAAAEVVAARTTVNTEKKTADDTARTEIAKGNAEAAGARLTAEREAAQKKKEAEKESSGVFGWLASKAKRFFNKIKSAIKKAFEYARSLVRAAIKKAKELAARAIEWARKKIVDAIKAVGAALIAIGDRLLKHFPTLRAKFRKAITAAVDSAIATVNKLAEKLNTAIQKALDTLGSALDAALGLLEKGLLAAVDVVAAAVDGALKLANAIVQALAVFAILIRDISANPIRWLQNLAAGAVDGVRNHLWPALKSAMSEWFTSKVESVLNLGTTVWEILKAGGLTIAAIGRMAWEGIKVMIPAMVPPILIEKLVSMIIPAAAAVMLIVEGLKAAWGTISRILAAFSKFIDFLKAVRSGTAGPPFAAVLAAAAVAVIDFIANWLIAKLAKGATRIAGKFKGLARRQLRKRRAKALRKGRKTRSTAPKKSRKGKTDEAAEKKKKERLDKAVAAIKPQLVELTRKGTSGIVLRAKLLYWRARYRLSRLAEVGSGGQAEFVFKVNPEWRFWLGLHPTDRHILQIVRILGASKMGEAQGQSVLAQAQRLRDVPRTGGTVQVGSTAVATKTFPNTYHLPFDESAYADYARRLKGIPDDILARHLRAIARGGPMPTGLSATTIEQLSALMFVVEPARAYATAVSSMQVVELMAQRRLTKEAAFAPPPGGREDAGGEFPMSPKGAVRQTRRLSAEMTGMAGTGPSYLVESRSAKGSRPGAARMANKELELFRKWWEMRNPGLDLYAQDEATITKFVQRALDDFYATRPVSPGPAAVVP